MKLEHEADMTVAEVAELLRRQLTGIDAVDNPFWAIDVEIALAHVEEAAGNKDDRQISIENWMDGQKGEE